MNWPVPGVVSDTSPLQYLHQLQLLELLPACFTTVHVPGEVLLEMSAGRTQGIELPDLTQCAWCTRYPVLGGVNLRGLGRGETAAIALAEQLGLPVLLDDLAARQLAEQRNLPVVGTIGVVLLAKELGLLPHAAPLLERLVDLGFRLNHATWLRALELAGEAGE